MQLAMRMRHIVICGLSGSTVLFHVISQTPRFTQKLMEREFSLQLCSQTSLILRRIQPDTIAIAHRSASDVSIILVRV
jgi:hypothetical protein